MTDKQLIAQAVQTVNAANALALGSPEALADCERRRLDAMAHAASLPVQEETIEDRLGSYFPDLPVEYDPTDDEGGD